MGLRTKQVGGWGWRHGDGEGGIGAALPPPQPGDPINPCEVGGTAGSCPRPALSSPSCNPFQRGGLGGFRAGFESEMGCFQIILRQLCPLPLMQRGIKIDMKIIGGEEAPPPVGGPAPPPTSPPGTTFPCFLTFLLTPRPHFQPPSLSPFQSPFLQHRGEAQPLSHCSPHHFPQFPAQTHPKTPLGSMLVLCQTCAQPVLWAGAADGL